MLGSDGSDRSDGRDGRVFIERLIASCDEKEKVRVEVEGKRRECALSLFC